MGKPKTNTQKKAEQAKTDRVKAFKQSKTNRSKGEAMASELLKAKGSMRYASILSMIKHS